MTRIVKLDRAGPYPVSRDDLGADGKAWICGCGLSATKPFCDSSHKTARQETPGKLVYYPGNDDANAPVEVDAALLPADAPASQEP